MMTIRKPVKIALAVASIIPILYTLFFMGFIFITMASAFSGKTPNKAAFDFMPALFMTHLAVMLLSFGLLAFYIFFLFKTDRVPQDKKVLWAVILFMGNAIAMPIFWYLYIWQEAAAPPAVEPFAAQ